MKGKKAASKPADFEKERRKTLFSNLVPYVPSSKYFARLRIAGKLIRKSLKTDVLSVAKLRSTGLENFILDGHEPRRKFKSCPRMRREPCWSVLTRAGAKLGVAVNDVRDHAVACG